MLKPKIVSIRIDDDFADAKVLCNRLEGIEPSFEFLFAIEIRVREEKRAMAVFGGKALQTRGGARTAAAMKHQRFLRLNRSFGVKA
ncbi:MAG: hypothetical protein MJ106_02110 [Lentisphaeria bacterium]|nr:hypothetical protein [Lentisphaeria bacterium]